MLQKKTLQLSNASNFSSIRQETMKLTGVESRAFCRQFFHRHYGKEPVPRHKWLDFPPWQRFICIHWQCMSPPVISLAVQRMSNPQFCFFPPCSLQALALFFGLFGHNTEEPKHCQKLNDHERYDFEKLLQWANFHGSRCSRYPSASTQGWVVVSWCLVRRPMDLLAQRWPPKCLYLLHSLLRGFQRFCGSKTSTRKSCARQKKVASRHDKQAETDLAIQFAWRRWLRPWRHRLPSAKPLAPRCATAETWYLANWYPWNPKIASSWRFLRTKVQKCLRNPKHKF